MKFQPEFYAQNTALVFELGYIFEEGCSILIFKRGVFLECCFGVWFVGFFFSFPLERKDWPAFYE